LFHHRCSRFGTFFAPVLEAPPAVSRSITRGKKKSAQGKRGAALEELLRRAEHETRALDREHQRLSVLAFTDFSPVIVFPGHRPAAGQEEWRRCSAALNLKIVGTCWYLRHTEF
jgi:hypothetical protein